MATMTRADIARQLSMTITGTFGDYKDAPTEWSQVFDSESMDRAVEEELLTVGTGLAGIKAEGAQVSYDKGGESYVARYEAIEIAIATAITEVAIEDNLWQKLGPKAGVWLERSLRNTKEILAANLFNYSTDSTRPIGDGQPLLSTAHPVKGGGTQANTFSIAQDLSESALEDAHNLILQLKDDRGMTIGASAKRLIIPTQLLHTANRLLYSKNRPSTTDNDINSINYAGVFGVDPAIMRRLTSSKAWFIKTDVMDGLKMKQRIAPKLAQFPNFETGSIQVKARERYAVGISNWRAVVGSYQ